MRRLRYIVASGVLVLGLALGVRQLLPLGGAVRQLLPRVMDRRCRGGCLSPLLRVLPGGPLASQVGTGALQDTWGRTVTDTRASSKTCCTNASCSTLVTLGNNQPCVDTVGLNVEGSATNRVVQSGAIGTAPWTTAADGSPAPGAITVTANACVAPDGTTTGTRVDFPATTSTNRAIVYQDTGALAASTSYSGSVWAKAISGEARVDVTLNSISSTTASMCTGLSTSTWKRCTGASGTTSGTPAATGYFFIGYDGSQDTNNPGPFVATSLCLWGAQLETGSFSTSYVATAGTTATRAADNASAGVYAIGHTPSFSADVTPANVSSGQVWLEATQGGSDRWTGQILNSSTFRCDYYNGTTSFAASASTTITAGTKYHVACYYDGANVGACVNGACTTSAQSFAALSNSYSINLGNFEGSGNYLNGEVANVCVAKTPGGCP